MFARAVLQKNEKSDRKYLPSHPFTEWLFLCINAIGERGLKSALFAGMLMDANHKEQETRCTKPGRDSFAKSKRKCQRQG